MKSKAASLVLAVVAVAALWGCGGDDGNAASDDAPQPPAPEDRCVEVWNGSDFSGKARAASQAERGDVVVRVTTAKDFPDKCLMIVAAADIGPGLVSIYREVGGTSSEPFRQVDGTTVDRLADLDKDWNARVDTDGNITKGYP